MRVNVYYDARLIHVLADEDGEGYTLKVVYNGETLSLSADPFCARRLVNQFSSGGVSECRGAARLVTRNATGMPARYCFDVYPDQTLQRAPELDVFEFHPQGYNVNGIGWRNALNPSGFLAPKGVIPGEQGHFISDSTETVEVDVPYEFTDLCTSLGREPVKVLRDFVAGACRLQNTAAMPRADGLASQGIEAETLIARYLELVYKKPGC